MIIQNLNIKNIFGIENIDLDFRSLSNRGIMLHGQFISNTKGVYLKGNTNDNSISTRSLFELLSGVNHGSLLVPNKESSSISIDFFTTADLKNQYHYNSLYENGLFKDQILSVNGNNNPMRMIVEEMVSPSEDSVIKDLVEHNTIVFDHADIKAVSLTSQDLFTAKDKFFQTPTGRLLKKFGDSYSNGSVRIKTIYKQTLRYMAMPVEEILITNDDFYLAIITPTTKEKKYVFQMTSQEISIFIITIAIVMCYIENYLLFLNNTDNIDEFSSKFMENKLMGVINQLRGDSMSSSHGQLIASFSNQEAADKFNSLLT
jgi:hypothetical protein